MYCQSKVNVHDIELYKAHKCTFEPYILTLKLMETRFAVGHAEPPFDRSKYDLALMQSKGPPWGRPGSRRGCRGSQRLENWKLFLALARPYFLRSTTRLSRVRNPAALSAGRWEGS